MGLFGKIFNTKNQEKLYPESLWEISIENKILKSIDWNKVERRVNLNLITKFYIRTTDTGPSCDVWYGIETEEEKIEIPQGANGEYILLDFMNSLDGFELKGMNSIENKIHLCWKKSS